MEKNNLPSSYPTVPAPSGASTNSINSTLARGVLLGFLLGGVLLSILVYFYQQKKIDDLNIAFSNRGMLEQKKLSQNSAAAAQQVYNYNPAPEAVQVDSQKFSSPYSVNWEEKENIYSLTGVEWGSYRITAEMALKGNWTKTLQENQIIDLIGLKIKINTGTNVSNCIEQTLRLVIEEDKFAPLNRQFIFPDSRGCVALPNTTYENLTLYFESPLNDTFHTFTNGDITFKIIKNSKGVFEPSLIKYKNLE